MKFAARWPAVPILPTAFLSSVGRTSYPLKVVAIGISDFSENFYHAAAILSPRPLLPNAAPTFRNGIRDPAVGAALYLRQPEKIIRRHVEVFGQLYKLFGSGKSAFS